MAESGSGASSNRFSIFLVVISTALALLVILLAIQNRDLKQQLASATHGSVPESPWSAGDAFGSLVLVDDSGEPTPVVFDGAAERTLLLIFSRGCPACVETLPIWSELLSENVDENLRILGVQLDRGAEPDGLVDASLPFPVFGVDHGASGSLTRVSHIPSTVILDGAGRVQKSWIGVLTDQDKREFRDLTSGT